MNDGNGEIVHIAFGGAVNKANRLKEPEARGVYLALGPGRSIRKVREHFGEKSVSERSLEAWSSKYGWRRLAREHDLAVQDEVALRLRDRDAEAKVSAASVFEQLAYAAAHQALHGIACLDPNTLKPRDLLHLITVSEKAEKIALLMESRAYLEPSPNTAHLIKRLISEDTEELVETVDWLRSRSVA